MHGHLQTPPVGIDRLSFFSSRYCVDLAALAAARGVPPARFTTSIGQEQMAVPPPGEDVITLAANAASAALAGTDPQRVDLLILGTESGIDQSKAGAAYLHQLLGLSPRCRIMEIKQACYGATAGLQLALPHLRQHPERAALVVGADVARYGLHTAGEPTQGAGAVAMLLTAHPRLLALSGPSGLHAEDVMDFWRPNYRDEALVDGKLSVRIYLRCLAACWQHYQDAGGLPYEQFARFCYHLPFTRMAETAHLHLAKRLAPTLGEAAALAQLGPGLYYNRRAGNCYTASLYLALLALLENDPADLAGQAVALFSYGSGCMAELFAGTVVPGYRDHLAAQHHQSLLATRQVLTVPEYEAFYRFALPTDGSTVELPGHYDTGAFRLTALRDHQRIYARV